MSDTGIIVDIIDSQGTIEASFSPHMGQSFVEAAEDNNIIIPTSCCAGACFTCACRVIEGQEDIDIGLLSVPLVDLEDDQVLSCVA